MLFFSLRVRLEKINLFELVIVEDVFEGLGFVVFVVGDVKIFKWLESVFFIDMGDVVVVFLLVVFVLVGRLGDFREVCMVVVMVVVIVVVRVFILKVELGCVVVLDGMIVVVEVEGSE